MVHNCSEYVYQDGINTLMSGNNSKKKENQRENKAIDAIQSFSMTSKMAQYSSYAWKNVVPNGLSPLLALFTSGGPEVSHGANAALISSQVDSELISRAADASSPLGQIEERHLDFE